MGSGWLILPLGMVDSQSAGLQAGLLACRGMRNSYREHGPLLQGVCDARVVIARWGALLQVKYLGVDGASFSVEKKS